VRITLGDPDAEGRRDLLIGDREEPGWFGWHATQHDLGDLEAVLAIDKAKSKHCAAELTEPGGDHHTCVMPPGHWIFPHVCRACPHEWVTEDLRARKPAAPGGEQPAIPVIADDRVPPGAALVVSGDQVQPVTGLDPAGESTGAP
jgi:hypothetical protein